MADDPVAINAKDPLPSFQQRTDRVAISRANFLYRVDTQDLPSRFTNRIELVPPLLSDFATVVQQSTSLTKQRSDGIRMFAPPNTPTGANIMQRLRTLPGGSWDIQLAILKGWTFINFINGGLVLRESGTGKLSTFGFGVPNDGQIQNKKYASPTSFTSVVKTSQETSCQFMFFRALLNGSNIEYHFSADGMCWALHHIATLTDAFTTAPNQWGFYLECNNSGLSVSAQMDVLHWDE